MCCGTVESVAREMKLGESSAFKEYAAYLNAQASGQLPSGWDEASKDLLRKVVGGESHIGAGEIYPDEPTEWLDYDWYTDCKGDRSDDVSAKAALLVVQRSDDEKMIPVYDMYNHRNGRWHNTVTATTTGKDHVTRASRDIAAGEQIYNSYNFCKECGGRRLGYGTGEIFRDYGFVDQILLHY